MTNENTPFIEEDLPTAEAPDIEEMSFPEMPDFDGTGAGLNLTPEQFAELEAQSPETAEMLRDIQATAQEIMKDGTGNPLMGQPIGKVIKSYLDFSTHGVRWLSAKARVPKARLVRYLEGNDDALTQDQTGRVIDIILEDRRRELARAGTPDPMMIQPRSQGKSFVNRAARRQQLSEARKRNRGRTTAL